MKAGSDSEQPEGSRRRSEAAPGGAEEEREEEAVSRTNKTAEKPVEEEKQQTNDDAVEEVPDDCGSQALKRVQEAEPSTWLAAPPSLLQSAMQASEYLFTLIATTCTEKNLPLDKLLTKGFDTEQVWQQIDLQAHPTLSSIKKRLRQIENTKVKKDFFVSSSFTKQESQRDSSAKKTQDRSDANDNLEDGDFDALGKSESDIEGSDAENDEAAEKDDGPDSEDREFSDYDEESKKVVEDKFLKLNEMEKFLDQADAEDAGISPAISDNDDREEDEEDADDDDLEVPFLVLFFSSLHEREVMSYSEFVGKAEGKKQKQRHMVKRVSDEKEELAKVDVEEESDDADDEELDDDDEQGLDETRLSTHERQQEKIKKRIEQLEKSNLDPKHWTLQGEITAAKRPKNSALEVELDFEHAARPAPVITEEVTASLEDIIRSRIIEERFDDVQRKAIVGDIAPKARVELDENKSKKGLGEIYEEEYMQSAGLAVAATPVTDSIKAEVTSLFKLLCLKLDALSHFHFAPKPVVEEMEIRSDVPALAMEEVAPMAVSVASMLAPEEVYKGSGKLVGESELTPDDRKRRRAQKKRSRKGAKKANEERKKARISNTMVKDPLKELNVRHIHTKGQRATSSFGKSAKVFADINRAQERGARPEKHEDDKQPYTPSFLKL
ncbi:unnamed protein product [Sphagnum troendelagicum]|uniref:U3 small nucleolar ribonucleoprotein protein MPP10 n=1 Tax=Sphagnum troendelagicum TaxID=128251 RepID=A0ABP0TXP1_9BRYO